MAQWPHGNQRTRLQLHYPHVRLNTWLWNNSTREPIAHSLIKWNGLSICELLKILDDKHGAIALFKNPVPQQMYKHIDIKNHLIRNVLCNSNIDIIYCTITDIVAAPAILLIPENTVNLSNDLHISYTVGKLIIMVYTWGSCPILKQSNMRVLFPV